MITAAAKHQDSILTVIGRALAWVWHSDMAVITAVTHHQVPQGSQGAVFAVTFLLILAAVTRRRKRSAG